MCHQTVCLVARHLEAHGIPTVVLGSAHDILRAGCPPRAVFVDYPLGHSAGKPHAADDQLAVVSGALDAFTVLHEPGQLLELPQRWGDDAWRAAASSTAAEDTRQARDASPQWQYPADRAAAQAAGAL